jgi:hypothetical protein
MKSTIMWVVILVVFLFPAPAVWAQTPASGNQSAATPAPSASTALVPRLIKFTGTLLDAQNRPMAGPVGVTFALYAQQRGGAALWMETQNVKPDANGDYAIFLGGESSEGVPAELFATGEARWLGIQVERQVEQERILLVSVPYALKAVDAESLGGLPASAYALAQASASTVGGVASTSGGAGTSGASGTNVPGNGATPQGTAAKPAKNARAQSAAAIATNFLPVFTDNAGTLGSSVLLQNPSSNFLGVGTASPVSALDLRLTGAAAGDVLSVGNQSGGGRFGVLSFSRGPGAPFIVQGDVSDDLVLGANLTEKMRITSAGNVGIGTSGPFATLDVKGTANQLVVESSTSGGEASMGFIPGGGMHKWQAGVNSTGPGFFVYENGGGYRFVVQQGGNVGIGTTTPTAALEVNGATKFDGPVAVNGNLASSGSISGTIGSCIGGLAVGSGFGVNAGGMITTPSVGTSALVDGSVTAVKLAPQTLNLSGAAFICAGTCTDAFFPPQGSMDNAKGTWAANVSLPQGTVVTALRLCGHFNDPGFSITATLDMTPLTAAAGHASAVAMASIASTGAADKTQCFPTTTITNATIDNTMNQYYVVVDVPDNAIEFSTVQIDY